MQKLPPLASLLAFDALYRTGSVTRAADMLGRTHSAVSKQLHLLQDHAGVTLFEKSGSGIELTMEGRAFAVVVAGSFADLRKAYETLQLAHHRQKVTLKVSSTFARAWAIPTVARFNRHHPDIEIQLSLTVPTNPHGIDGSVDLVLSWDRLASPIEPTENSISLGDVHIGPVLSPTYDYKLEKGVFSFSTQINRRGSEVGWQNWSNLTGMKIASEHEIILDLAGLTYEAAEQGMGVALAPKFLVEKELKSGTLIAPVGFYCFKEGLIVRPSMEKPVPSRNAQIFLDWLGSHGRLDKDGYLAPEVLDPVWG
ncbi:LysR family transcriptional regulator [uncultured Cohaesibacter sp.]|uniref:LysR family transcriptional regulator n=1 Tax=uncultured Cohaesibacter sp. TaxID=1002546 RepID=UPI002931A23C|nr:LysR family transcriptional regulator [uncultured Cohaesibacter sp.]